VHDGVEPCEIHRPDVPDVPGDLRNCGECRGSSERAASIQVCIEPDYIEPVGLQYPSHDDTEIA